MQMAPFAHHVLLVVAVVPAMQAMLRGVGFLLFGGFRFVRQIARSQDLLESVEHGRNVIVRILCGARVDAVVSAGSSSTAWRQFSRMAAAPPEKMIGERRAQLTRLLLCLVVHGRISAAFALIAVTCGFTE